MRYREVNYLSVEHDVRMYVIHRAREKRQEKWNATKLKWMSVFQTYFGWVTWKTLLIVCALVVFIVGTRPAHADAIEQVTMLVPSKEGVPYPSIKVSYSSKDMKSAAAIIADFKKQGLQKSSEESVTTLECEVRVVKSGYLLACFMHSLNGTCTLGPAIASRRSTIELLGSYYRGCSMNGIVTPRIWS